MAIPQYTISDYSKFALAGAIGCGVTHGAMTPIDVVKTRIQLDPVTYNKGTMGSFRQVMPSKGSGALLTGLGPSVMCSSLQVSNIRGGYRFSKRPWFKN